MNKNLEVNQIYVFWGYCFFRSFLTMVFIIKYKQGYGANNQEKWPMSKKYYGKIRGKVQLLVRSAKYQGNDFLILLIRARAIV